MEELRIDPSIAYDVIELPSKGIYYDNKITSLRIAYLTASDENILNSPNLNQNSDKLIDELLKRKVLDRSIKIEDIVEEDKRAILIFLRNTAFGPEYVFNLMDPKTNESFRHTVDLGSLNFKDFNLIADENGEYSFFMEKSNVNVTFKFLTQKEERDINKLVDSWNGNGVAPIITKQLEMMIKSINGSRDVMAIHNFTENLPIKDSQDFRKYVKEQKPGLNLNQQAIAPSGEKVEFTIGFGVEFFRPFFGI